MRLRRLEIIVIGVTLAFALFTGGFFTGRSTSSVSIVQTAEQSGQHRQTDISVKSYETVSTQEPSTADINETTASTGTVIEQPARDNSSPAEIVGAPRGGDGKININIATQSELTDLPGIGSTLASRIVDYRRQHGDFQRIEDIRNVSGIGEKRYEAIEDKITVG